MADRVKLTEAEARERSKLPAPFATLRDIANGRMLISLNHTTGNADLEEYDGKKYRDPEFPDRKMFVSGGMTLYWAGYLTAFGTVTPAGRALLASNAKGD